MKTTIKSIVIALAALSLASCATTNTAGGAKPYTSDDCIVSDNKLGSMGTPVTLVHEGQQVKFCCQPCVAKFKANPDKYLASL